MPGAAPMAFDEPVGRIEGDAAVAPVAVDTAAKAGIAGQAKAKEPKAKEQDNKQEASQ